MTEPAKIDLDHIDVAYVARLARVALSADEIDAFGRQLDDVLRYVDQIRRIDVDGIEPTAHPFPLENVFRDDHPVAADLADGEVARNAPHWQGGTFVVPRIIE